MGELARQPGCPELAKTPLELLTTRTDQGFVLPTKHLWPLSGVVGAIATMKYINFLLSRPPWAGIQNYFILGGAAAVTMIFIRDFKEAARAETDEIYKHYVTLHPDDFPPFERKRYKDIYEPFHPYR